MSKSILDPKGTILLLDDPAEARKKVMSATTDSVEKIQLDYTQQPGIGNLLQLSASLQGRAVSEVAEEWRGQTQYGQFKKSVADQVGDFLSDFQAKYATISDEEAVELMTRGEEVARELSERKLEKVQQAVGLRQTKK